MERTQAYKPSQDGNLSMWRVTGGADLATKPTRQYVWLKVVSRSETRTQGLWCKLRGSWWYVLSGFLKVGLVAGRRTTGGVLYFILQKSIEQLDAHISVGYGGVIAAHFNRYEISNQNAKLRPVQRESGLILQPKGNVGNQSSQGGGC